MEEQLNKLSLLPKFRDSAEEAKKLRSIYDLDVDEETKSLMVDVLYKKHEEDITKEINNVISDEHRKNIDKEIKDLYDRSSLPAHLKMWTHAHHAERHRAQRVIREREFNLPKYLSIDHRGNGPPVRMTEETFAFFTNVYQQYKKIVSESIHVCADDIIPKVYGQNQGSDDDLGEDTGPEMVEYDFNGYSCLWNKKTNELIDPDDSEVMGTMVADEDGNWKPQMKEVESDSDCDSDCDSE